MATVAELLVKINANSTGLRKELASSQRQMKRAFGSEALEASGKAAGLLGVLTAAIGAAGVASISLSGKLRMTQKAFETLTGSAETAKNMIGELKSLDDKSSFSFDTYAKGAQKLLALGTAADQVIPTLTTIGDASAALGQGEEGIDRIVLALSQITAKGKVSAQEMNQLAENNVQGWRYLADEMGISIAEVMKLAEKGAINGTAAVKTILAGMDKDFKGSMNKVADETPIVWNTIVSSAQQILAGIGPVVDEAFGINKTLIKVRDYLVEFKTSIDKIGIKETLAEMVPPSATVAITTLAATLVGVAVPALHAFALSAAAALVPLLPYIAVGAAVGLAIAGITAAVKSHAVETQREIDAVNKQRTSLESLTAEYQQLKSKTNLAVTEKKRLVEVQNQISDISPEVVKSYDKEGNAVIDLNAALKAQVALKRQELQLSQKQASEEIKNTEKQIQKDQEWITNQQNLEKIKMDQAKEYRKQMGQSTEISNEAAVAMKKVWFGADYVTQIRKHNQSLTEAKEKLAELKQQYDDTANLLDGKVVEPVKKVNDDSKSTGKSGASSLLQGGNGDDKLKEKAKSLHETLDSAWAQTNDNDKEQLDIWYNQQKDALDKVGDAYGTYDEDRKTLDAIYDAKSKKLDNDKLQRIKELKRAAQDDVTNNQNQSSGIGLIGVDKDLQDLQINYDQTLTGIGRKYEDLQTEFSTATAAEKQEMIAAWQEAGYAFKEYADGTVNFNEQAAKERLTTDQQYYSDLLALRYDYQKNEDVLSQARKDGNIAAYMEQLSTEQALMSEDLAGRQAMMDTYYEIWQAAHMTAMGAMAEMTSSAFSGLETFFADIINGVSSIGDAWSKLKGSVLTMIGQMVAKWIAGQLMMLVTGQMVQKKSTAASTESATTTATAWAPAAALTSIASWGSNMAPALIAIGVVLAAALAASAFASGGSVSGPGNGTSDSVWARLSDGEYVMKAATVKKFGTGFFDSINAGRMPAFATGGLVTGSSLSTMGAAYLGTSPISSKSFDKTSTVQQSAGDQYQITLQTIDGKSTEYWLENGGGSKVIKFLKKEVRSFTPVGV